MTSVDVYLKLPETLVQQARDAGILTDERVAELLTAELERRARVVAMFSDMEKLHALQPPLSPDEIDEELRAYRAEQAARRKASN